MRLNLFSNKPILFFILGAFAIYAGGCAKLGPSTIQSQRANYNLAVQRTNDEQLLLNLARLKYRDNPLFLEVSSVASQFILTTTGNASATLQEGIKGLFGLGGAVGLTEKPTVTYSPLQGNKFIQRVLTPLPLKNITLLYNSGWSIERIFRLCFQRMNNLKNAPGASGPTPKKAPNVKAFIKATKLLRELETLDLLSLAYETENDIPKIILSISDEGKNSSAAQKFFKVMNLKPGLKNYAFTLSTKHNEPNQIRVVPRSLLGILFYLSQAVEVPEQDIREGKVTRTLKTSGEIFDWNEVTGELLRIRSDSSQPENATLMVSYRGTWFYIEDSDLKSKSTFSLLSQIFSLQATKIKRRVPILTLPIGR